MDQNISYVRIQMTKLEYYHFSNSDEQSTQSSSLTTNLTKREPEVMYFLMEAVTLYMKNS